MRLALRHLSQSAAGIMRYCVKLLTFGIGGRLIASKSTAKKYPGLNDLLQINPALRLFPEGAQGAAKRSSSQTINGGITMIAIKNAVGQIVALLTIEEYIHREAAELAALMEMAKHDPS
jgi:hypothetical protein